MVRCDRMMVLNDRIPNKTGRWDFRPFVTPFVNVHLTSVEKYRHFPLQFSICMRVSVCLCVCVLSSCQSTTTMTIRKNYVVDDNNDDKKIKHKWNGRKQWNAKFSLAFHYKNLSISCAFHSKSLINCKLPRFLLHILSNFPPYLFYLLPILSFSLCPSGKFIEN